MAVPLPDSLFPQRARVDGSEIKFRAVCALGWALRENFFELRSIADELPQDLDHVHWIDFIETRAIEQFTARAAKNWPERVCSTLIFLKDDSAVQPFPKLRDFFERLAAEAKKPEALDPVAQFAGLNSRGFALANQYINDPDWSTDRVRAAWQITREHLWAFVDDSNGNFRPVTSIGKDRIEVRVNTAKFDCKNALLFYLTAEYQMMHEYISHLLPVWNSGNALEEEFLLAVMFLYFRERGPGNGMTSLVWEADERRGDSHRRVRNEINHELAPALEAHLSRLLLELAVLDEEAMPLSAKRHVVALLKRALAQKGPTREFIRRGIAEGNLLELYAKLKTAFSDVPSRSFSSKG